MLLSKVTSMASEASNNKCNNTEPTVPQLLFFLNFYKKNLNAYSKSQIDNVYLIDAYR